MYPILAILALGLAIAFERLICIINTQGRTQKIWHQLVPMIDQPDETTQSWIERLKRTLGNG